MTEQANKPLQRTRLRRAAEWKLLAPDDPEMYEEARSDSRPRGPFARLFSAPKRRKGMTEDLDLDPDEGEDTDLDKAGGQLREKFNPEDMMAKEIYPQIWDRDPADDDSLGYLMEYFEVLRGCVTKIVEQRYGFVVSIQ